MVRFRPASSFSMGSIMYSFYVRRIYLGTSHPESCHGAYILNYYVLSWQTIPSNCRCRSMSLFCDSSDRTTHVSTDCLDAGRDWFHNR